MNFENQFDGPATSKEEKKTPSREGLRDLTESERAELREDLLKKRQEFLDSRE